MSFCGLIAHFFLSPNKRFHCMACHSLFIHLSLQGHFVCFKFLAIENKALETSCAGFCVHMFSSPLSEHLGAWVLDCMVRLCLASSGTASCLPKRLCHSASPASCAWVSVALHHHHYLVLSLCVCILAILICVLASHHCFNLSYLVIKHFFTCLFVTYLSSWLMCCFRFFSYFLIR